MADLADHQHTQHHTSLTDVSDEWPSLAQVFETASFQGGYNTNLVITSTMMLGIAAGIVGVLALLRKRSLVADALSHATLPGLALAFIVATWLGVEGRSLPVLLFGAAASGVLGIFTTQWILRYTRLTEDAAIGLVLSIFFGAGTVLLSIIQQMPTGNSAGIVHFIFGQTAAVTSNDSWLMVGIAATTIIAATLLLKECALVCFNDSFAKVDGWPVSLIDLLMMSLLVIVTVAGMQAVGLLLVVAMLIIPAVAARFWTDRLWVLIVVAAIIGGISGYCGSVTSALLPRKPAGAVIVLICGIIFLVSMMIAPKRGILAGIWRRFQLRLRLAVDHALEAAHLSPDNCLPPAQLAQLSLQRNWSTLLRWAIRWRLRTQQLGSWQPPGFQASERGLLRGKQVARNHLLWQQYLITYADIAPQHVDWTADQVEHVLEPAIIQELEDLLSEQHNNLSDSDTVQGLAQ